MSKLRGLAHRASPADFFAWMDGYCEAFEDLPDGAWQAACEGAVAQFNRDHGTRIDPYDGWIAWAVRKAANMENEE